MPRYAIVIKDPALVRAKEIERNVEFNARVKPHIHRRVITAAVMSMVGPERPAGTVHTVMDSECPVGLPNCRNCGDPAFAEECKAAGHCPQCGTDHGLAPDGVLAASGYELIEE